MTAEEILAKAADLVEFSGKWVNREPRCGELCLRWALWQVEGHTREARRAMAALETEVDGLTGEYLSTIIFNETPGRTKEEVAAALRNAKRWLA